MLIVAHKAILMRRTQETYNSADNGFVEEGDLGVLELHGWALAFCL